MRGLGDKSRREKLWTELKARQSISQSDQPYWDLIVVGGGIVGAGVFREALRLNLKVLLLEQQDFSWGTSSRSSKMVHGGLRYVASGDFRITRESVTERQRLLKEAAGLVTPLQYLFADRKWQFPGRWAFTALLNVYDLFAGRRDHRFLHKDELELQAPRWKEDGLNGACQYSDAATDDARLVLRVLQEAVQEGDGELLNYVAVEGLLKESGQVVGVQARNHLSDEKIDIRAKAVINATGAWADNLRGQVGGEKKIRPLRGSHLIFPYWRLPVSQAITMMHPKDRRPIFIFPWEGVTVVGTTDLDHKENLNREAAISGEEIDYLFELINEQFPSLNVCEGDVISTFSGVRPVVSSGKLDPSAERRDHSVWNDKGLISVSGGKLTTFRLIALDALKEAAKYLPLNNLDQQRDLPIFSESRELDEGLQRLLTSEQQQRLLGRYGNTIAAWLEQEDSENFRLIPSTQTLWTELRYAAENEAVCHLDDLLLRRTRIGLMLKNGAVDILEEVRELCQPLLGWDNKHWQDEVERYKKIYQNFYSLPKR